MTAEFNTIDDQARDAYQKLGAICLRGAFTDQVDLLRDGVQRNQDNPGTYFAENVIEGDPGRFWDDYCNWQRIPEFKKFITDSAAAQLAAGVMGSEKASLIELLRQSKAQEIQLPGLNIKLDSLAPQYQQRNEGEIRQRIAELRQEHAELESERQAAQALDAATSLKAQLEKEVRDIEGDLEAFDHLTDLKQSEDERNAGLVEAEQRKADIDRQLAQFGKEGERLRQALAAVEKDIERLCHQNEEITKKKDQRGDEAEQFDYLAELPHHPWLGGADFPLSALLEQLTQYQADCQIFHRLNM